MTPAQAAEYLGCKPIMSREEAAQIIGCDVHTLRAYRAQGLSCIRVGARGIRFSASEVVRWLEARGLEVRRNA